VSIPRSPFDQAGGLVYFPRMLDKIRLHARGELDAAYQANLGGGFDGRCCHLLGLPYERVKERVLAGGSDDEVLAWALQEGRGPDEQDREVWNAFMLKRGWRDEVTERLANLKAQRGFADREDLVTYFEFLDADEGR
jgi:gluconokinase